MGGDWCLGIAHTTWLAGTLRVRRPMLPLSKAHAQLLEQVTGRLSHSRWLLPRPIRPVRLDVTIVMHRGGELAHLKSEDDRRHRTVA